MPVPRRYQIFDVFTDRPLAGNPLAVVLDAEGLDDGKMQAIAREFNLSETIFVLPAENPAHSARVRIFTPDHEMPFAGHPTVGAAVCLAIERFGRSGRHDAVVVLEEEVGPVRCGVTVEGQGGFAEFDCPKLPSRAGEPASKDLIAAAANLLSAEIGFENHVPSVWSAGAPYHFVPLRNLAALGKVSPSRSAWSAAFGKHPAYFYTRETEGYGHAFSTRMFAPGSSGMYEDPATGSAAAALAGSVHDFDALPAGTHPMVIEQGFEMDRPSLIRLEITVEGGAIATVRIGGDAVLVAEGTLEV